MAERHVAEQRDVSGLPRRVALKTMAAALAGAAAATAGVVGIEAFTQTHPTPTKRVSPLIQGDPIGSPTKIIWRGNTSTRRGALTFDDGPDPQWTPMALDMPAKHGAKGTFFMLGGAVADHPEIAKKVAQAGHEIGSHSWDHQHMTVRTAGELADSLSRTHTQIITATDKTPTLMRPPYGQFDGEAAFAIARMNYVIALWSHRMTADDPWARARENIATATPGMIMLSHDGRGTPTAELLQAADWMIGQLHDQGWDLVTVSELFDPALD